MAFILNEKYIGHGPYLVFIKSRLLRIYPLYLTVLFPSILLSLFWIKLGLPSPIQALQNDINTLHISTLLYVVFENIFIITSDIGSFFDVNNNGIMFFSPQSSSSFPFIYTHSFIPQAWTLSIELIFYIISPLLVKRRFRTLILVLTLSLTVRQVIYSLGYHHEPWTNKFAPSELLFFVLGIIAYKIYAIKKLDHLKKYFLAPYLLLIIMTILYEKIPGISYGVNFSQWLYFLLLTILLPFVFYYFKTNKIDRFLGELSYPVYLSHVLVMFLVRNAQLGMDSNITGITAILLTLLISILLKHYIIDKIDDVRIGLLQQKTSR